MWRYRLAVLLLFATGIALFARAQSPSRDLLPVSRGLLCITEGEISETSEKLLAIESPKMRAYVNGTSTPEAEVRFTFLGGTAKDVPLGSGEMRRQFGLKLLAQDPCNLVYVMWRMEPESKLVVSVKSNPGQHTSAECGNRGYRNLTPLHPSKVPVISAGSTHTLHAVLNGAEVRVTADGALVWEGTIDGETIGLRGPVGVRSDNARLKFAFRTHMARESPSVTAPGCKTEAAE